MPSGPRSAGGTERGVLPPVPNTSAYLTYSELIGQKLPIQTILGQIGELEWSSALTMVAAIASVVANRGGPSSAEASELTRVELMQYRASHPLVANVIARLKGFDPDRAIVHEQILLHLASLMVLHAGDRGRTATFAEITFWALVLNDYLDEPEPTDTTLSPREILVADMIRLGRFNWMRDRVAIVARMAALFQLQPPRGRWAAPDKWAEFQTAAFGMSAVEFLETYLGPLIFISTLWGRRRQEDGLRVGPVVRPAAWLEGARIDAESAKNFLADLTADRGGLRSLLGTKSNGLPQAPSAIYRTPLIKLDEDRSLAVSPWLLLEQLRVGLWARLRKVVTLTGGTSQEWLSTFGDLFDLSCGRVAKIAADAPGFSGKVTVPSSPGAVDEFEDVIVEDDGAVILFSAKASLVRDDVAKGTTSRLETIEWYQRFFLAEADERNRQHRAAGAITLLQQKVSRIRAGQSPFPSDVEIIPVVVTFDEFVMYPIVVRWLRDQCVERQLLQGAGVRPITIASIVEFEELLSLSMHGRRLVDLLRKKTSETHVIEKLDSFLHDEAAGDRSLLRMPSMQSEFDAFTDRLRRKLWPGGEVPAPEPS
jgi:hypothetical protein